MARKRRTAEQARKLILDAAERQLGQVGPAGIRLQEVAAEVGVSHPAILHHFGSREGLVNAVIERAVSNLEGRLVGALSEAVDAPQATGLLNQILEVLGDKGHARLIAWVILSGKHTADEAGHDIVTDRTLEKISDAIHTLRVDARGDEAPRREDTVFAVMLAGLALFAEGIAGQVMRDNAGIGDEPGAQGRFREWFARLLVKHFESRGV